jgi:hypothetical protein
MQLATESKMGEEIVRKVINRKSCLMARCKKNRHLKSPCQSSLNLPLSSLLKRTMIKPCMTSTPQKYRRKTIDNSECETVTQRKGRGKTGRDSNVPIESITPIGNEKMKHRFGLVKGITSLNGRTCVCRNVCGGSFDISAVKSLTQSRMLSLDDSMLEAVDLDSAVKDYWDSQNRNLNLDNQSTKYEDRCGSPDLFEGGGNVIEDQIINSTPLSDGAASCKAVTQCSRSQCDVGNPSSNILHKCVINDSECKDPHGEINSSHNANFQSIDVAWENDSFFEDAVYAIDRDIQISDSTDLSNLPLGEKIKRTLITNVQKPVTPKPKNMQENARHVPQNSSSSMDKLSALSETGLFFGLPMKMKFLIQKFKGISDLYRKFCVQFCLLFKINSCYMAQLCSFMIRWVDSLFHDAFSVTRLYSVDDRMTSE